MGLQKFLEMLNRFCFLIFFYWFTFPQRDSNSAQHMCTISYTKIENYTFHWLILLNNTLLIVMLERSGLNIISTRLQKSQHIVEPKMSLTLNYGTDNPQHLAIRAELVWGYKTHKVLRSSDILEQCNPEEISNSRDKYQSLQILIKLIQYPA